MDFTVPQIATYIGCWFGVMAGIWALFDRAETVIKAEKKASYAKWLLSREIIFNKDWAENFQRIFIRIFGKRHFSVRCFFVSALTSIISVTLLTLLWVTIDFDSAKVFFLNDEGLFNLFLIFLLAGIVDFIPDYISLYQTRVILRWMASPNVKVPSWFLILADLVLTTAIVWLVFFGSLLLIDGFNPQVYEKLLRLLFSGYLMDGFGMSGPTFGIFIYSTYLTSVWLWLYILSAFGIRILSFSSYFLRFMKGTLDIEEKPLRSMGFVAMLLVTILFIVVPFLR